MYLQGAVFLAASRNQSLLFTVNKVPCNEQSAKNASGNRNGWEIEEKVQKSCWSYASVCRSNFTKSIWLNCSVCRWCFIFICHPNSCRMYCMNTIQFGALLCNCYYSLFVFKLLCFHILNMDVLTELLSASVHQIGLPQNFHSLCNATANLIIKVTGIWIISSWKHNGCSSSHRSIPKISPHIKSLSYVRNTRSYQSSFPHQRKNSDPTIGSASAVSVSFKQFSVSKCTALRVKSKELIGHDHR